MTEVDFIVAEYRKSGSVKHTAAVANCTHYRVKKVLATVGIVINPLHEEILELYNEGYDVPAIARKVRRAEKTVQAYVPAQRSCIYNVNPSKNALAIKRCREKKNIGLEVKA